MAAVRFTVPSVVLPSMNVTLPVGGIDPWVAVTVAVNVTGAVKLSFSTDVAKDVVVVAPVSVTATA